MGGGFWVGCPCEWAERALAWLKSPGRNTILIVPQLVWGRWARRSVHQGHADRGVQPCRREFHSVVTGRDRLGCFNVPGVLAAAEPGAARAKVNPKPWN